MQLRDFLVHSDWSFNCRQANYLSYKLPVDQLAEVPVDPSLPIRVRFQIRPRRRVEARIAILFDVKRKMLSTQFFLPRNGPKTTRYGASWYYNIQTKKKNYPILHFEDFFFSFLHSCIVYFFDKVSSTPATRLDVLALQEQLDSRLKQRQAREIGICPIRRELYSQCFGTRTNLSITINSRHIVLRKENHLCRRTD